MPQALLAKGDAHPASKRSGTIKNINLYVCCGAVTSSVGNFTVTWLWLATQSLASIAVVMRLEVVLEVEQTGGDVIGGDRTRKLTSSEAGA